MKELIPISVIGAGQCSKREARLAEEVGREIARAGAVLICGGLGGVMEAASRGASVAGGLVVGILPGENPKQANPYVKLAIASGVGRARNMAIAKSARAVIAVGGGYGTLSEIAYALQSGIPVIGLNTWGLIKNGKPQDVIIKAETAAEAVKIAMKLGAKT
jgi:uncharacterized protein (TIGR00725 family)